MTDKTITTLNAYIINKINENTESMCQKKAKEYLVSIILRDQHPPEVGLLLDGIETAIIDSLIKRSYSLLSHDEKRIAHAYLYGKSTFD